MKGRIYTDFNSTDERGERIFLGVEGSWQIELYRPLTWLRPGAVVDLYDEELQVEAVLELDEGRKAWYARPNWSSKRILKSKLDGLEVFRAASPAEKLEVLRIQILPLIGIIRGCTGILRKIVYPQVSQALPNNEWIVAMPRLLDNLDRVADEIQGTIDILFTSETNTPTE
jgi:hypothetical protein